MSAYPLVLSGECLEALVVGGGRVAERKTGALLASGARVRAVAPTFTDGLHALAAQTARLTLVTRAYEPGDVGDALLVIAATDDREVNRRVAGDAHARTRLVNVADDPGAGNCVTVASHRAGDLLVAVSGGGVPPAAARIRDAIAERFDARYATALAALARLRAGMLDRGDRAGWRRAVRALVNDRFCEAVERGTFADEVARWR